jgi:hypothetical protein
MGSTSSSGGARAAIGSCFATCFQRTYRPPKNSPRFAVRPVSVPDPLGGRDSGAGLAPRAITGKSLATFSHTPRAQCVLSLSTECVSIARCGGGALQVTLIHRARRGALRTSSRCASMKTEGAERDGSRDKLVIKQCFRGPLPPNRLHAPAAGRFRNGRGYARQSSCLPTRSIGKFKREQFGAVSHLT